MEISRAIKEHCSSHGGRGKGFSNSLEDLLIETGLYAAGTTATLMLGRSYNRRIHAQKLTMEAFSVFCGKCLQSGLKVNQQVAQFHC